MKTWNLYKLENGSRTLLGSFDSPDGPDAWGCDMNEWMIDCGHYGEVQPDDYDWDGDSESVAIMAKEEGKPDFSFVWE